VKKVKSEKKGEGVRGEVEKGRRGEGENFQFPISNSQIPNFNWHAGFLIL
jgi:hypothetical protein